MVYVPASFSWSWVWVDLVNDSEPQCYINADMGPGAVVWAQWVEGHCDLLGWMGGIKGLWTLFFFWFRLLQCEYRPGSTELSRQVVLPRAVGKVLQDRWGLSWVGVCSLYVVVCIWRGTWRFCELRLVGVVRQLASHRDEKYRGSKAPGWVKWM